MKTILSEKACLEIGIAEYGYISSSEIVFGEEVRKICEGNVCRQYGTTWACPPAVGTVAQCQNICRQYKNAMVFSSVFHIADSFDFEGMAAGHRSFKAICDRLYKHVKANIQHFLLLSNEGCIRCKQCTYPNAPCRFPELLFPSVEGFGIYINKLAESANIRYTNGANTVTYFGLLLY
jgi:predicted metal-binding protein